jgi:BASS family bile acid:Na+ symporter
MRFATVLMIPVSFLLGFLFARWLSPLAILMGPMLVVMLLLTFLRLRLTDLRLHRAHLAILGFQLVLAPAAFFSFLPWGMPMALAGLIIALTPTATAAPAMVGMLRGDVGYVTVASLLTNTSLSLLMPLAIILFTGGSVRPDLASTAIMVLRVLAVVLGPLLLALAVRRMLPGVAAGLTKYPQVPFYLWSFTLAVITAKTTTYLQDNPQPPGSIVTMAGVAALLCGINFGLGRLIPRFTTPRSAVPTHIMETAQSLGQKNTLFTIYVALSVLNSPVIALAPTFYILWHNCYNAVQLFRHRPPGERVGSGRTDSI